MRFAKLSRVFAEQVLAVMIVNRGAKVRFARGDEALPRNRLVAERFMPVRLLAPDAAPVGPAIDARDQPLQVVGIDAGRHVSRGEVRKNQVNLRIGCHANFVPDSNS